MLAREIAQKFASAVDGVSIGRLDDKSTWRVDYKGSATDEQRAAVASYIASLADPALISAKRRAREAIDQTAEQVRLLYITPGAGMAQVYQEKFAQAQAVAGMGEAAANAMSAEDRLEQFPTLAASVGLEAASLWECAQLVLSRYTQFAALSYPIERARIAGKLAVDAATTVQGVADAEGAVAWPMP